MLLGGGTSQGAAGKLSADLDDGVGSSNVGLAVNIVAVGLMNSSGGDEDDSEGLNGTKEFLLFE